MIAFLVGSAILILVVSNYFLIPAMIASHDATAAQKRQLAAYSRLLLAIVLFIMIVGLLLLFRVRRFFFPGQGSRKQQKTPYVDAWEEAGRRVRDRPVE
jgi:hypothetical protein